ncbi:hypothetical protein [Streptacidiphilus sp. MAP5-3]|uniref:hypothetical protein n=1 Tax=unclassified Streptacidiphilus TaxID=2643834 RepID=UPI003516F58F
MTTRIARIAGWTVVLGAAFAYTAWSLYVVAHDRYGVPAVLAAFAGAVFDGAALLALDAWASAAEDPRQSTLRPRVVAVCLLATSIYLNVTHATWQHLGTPAAVLFAAPGIVLWAMAELRLGARHTTARHAHGLGFAPRPAYGVEAWVVRRGRAWRAYTQHLDERLDNALPTVEPVGEVVARNTALLPVAPQVNGTLPGTLTAAIMAAATALGPTAQPSEIADLIARHHALDIDHAQIRAVLSRETKRQNGLYP